MFPGLNPKKMQAVMKQMGIAQDEIPALRVVIEKEDGGKLVINNPSVTKIKMQGQESFQVTGDISEEAEEVGVSEEDINTVVEKTGCTSDQAEKVLKNTDNLADAILELSE